MHAPRVSIPSSAGFAAVFSQTGIDLEAANEFSTNGTNSESSASFYAGERIATPALIFDLDAVYIEAVD